MRKMGELVNLDKEPLSSDLSRLWVPQNNESKESARIVREEKPFTLDVNENELYEGSEETVTFVTKIEIEENPFAYNCDACYEGFQKEPELKAHNCSRTFKEQHTFTNGCDESERGFSDESEKTIPLKIKEEDSASGDHDASESGFSDESEKKMPLKIKEEDSASRDVGGKCSGESESKILAGGNPFACDVWEKGFSEESELKAHLSTHKEERSPYCDLCDKKFASVANLKAHLRTHAQKKYACEVCSEGFSHRHLFQRHVLRHVKDEGKPFACTVCGRRFPDEFKMKMHHIGHTVEAPFVCDICKREFSKKQHLVRHIYIHTGERPFVCEVCNKGFYRTSELKIHTLSHDEERQMRCEFCKKGFLRESSLKIHLRNHTGDKPFVCSVCEKGFSQACDLRIHSYIHTEERPFACDVCNKGFYKRSFLVRHRLVHDKLNFAKRNKNAPNFAGDPDSIVDEDSDEEVKTTRGKRKRYLCRFCEKGYLTQRRLKIHLRNHSENTPSVCAVCQKRYSRACDLENHPCVRTAKPFACDICNEGFSRKCVLTKHRRTHEETNHLFQDNTTDDQIRTEVSFPGSTDHSGSNEASGDAKAEVSLEEKAASRFVLNETSDEVPFVDEKWFSSSPTKKNSRTRGVRNRTISQKLTINYSSQSHPKTETFVGDARHKEIPPRGKKVPRHSKGKRFGPGSFACNECDKVYSHLFSLKRHLQTHKLEETGLNQKLSTQRVKSPSECLEETSRQSEGKIIGPGSFACNECGNVYSHLSSLKRHLQTHEIEATGVNLHLSTQRVKSPIESLEENVHLFAPFKNFV